MKYGVVISLVLVGLTAFSPVPQKSYDTEYYHNLRNLRHAGAPRPLLMVKVENLGSDKSSLREGLLFTYKNRDARMVSVAGNFSSWKAMTMMRNSHGIWYFFLERPLTEKKIRYKFMVDGTWISDPANPLRHDDGYGSYLSMAEGPEPHKTKKITYRLTGREKVEFRLYRPEARMVTIVGDFNNWNPENDLLMKSSDGIWRLTKRIPAGRYRYQYIVDGKWEADLYNSDSASDDTGMLCSILTVH